LKSKTFNISPKISSILETVSDPEIPVLTVLDLGVVREVVDDGKKLLIKITPTYSGCPAMDTIAADIITAFADKGIEVDIELILAPAWTTDWISEEGKRKLEEYGVAAPVVALLIPR